MARRTSAWAAAVAAIIYISHHHFSMRLNFTLYLTLLLIIYIIFYFLLLKLQNRQLAEFFINESSEDHAIVIKQWTLFAAAMVCIALLALISPPDNCSITGV
ncbi:MAG: hypothetical protein DI619_01810 [Francisella sp.]|nr:MAG: hypothetical protein DI619_01810 [Francisella sp.]